MITLEQIETRFTKLIAEIEKLESPDQVGSLEKERTSIVDATGRAFYAGKLTDEDLKVMEKHNKNYLKIFLRKGCR